MHEAPETFDLERTLSFLRRRIALIAISVLVVGAVGYVYSKHQTKRYTAHASVSFAQSQLSQQIAGLPTTNVGNQLQQQANNVEQVRLGEMAAQTAGKIGAGLTEQRVARAISVSPEGESNVVGVTATAKSGPLAAAIANTYVEQFIRDQAASTKRYFTSAMALVSKQLAALSPKQRLRATGIALQNRLTSLALLSELDAGNVQVASSAAVPSSPSSPKTSRNTGFGLLLGLVLGLGLAFVFERLDTRVREPAALEAIYGAPILGSLARRSAVGRGVGQPGAPLPRPPAGDAEALRLIRARLMMLGDGHMPRTLMVASASRGDGRTTAARGMAATSVTAGRRVILVEADLRHPALTALLGLQPGPGLGDVLAGSVPIAEATQSVELEPTGSGRARKLDVLAAGEILPSNPGELLESGAMSELLERLRSQYDLIVIDTPPLTSVSDALPLLGKADGVLLVGALGHTRSDAAEQAQALLAESPASVLGLVAVGARSTGAGFAGRESSATASGPQMDTVGRSSEALAPVARL